MTEDDIYDTRVDVVTSRTEAYAMLMKTLNETSNPKLVAEGLKMLIKVRESLPSGKVAELRVIDNKTCADDMMGSTL